MAEPGLTPPPPSSSWSPGSRQETYRRMCFICRHHNISLLYSGQCRKIHACHSGSQPSQEIQCQDGFRDSKAHQLFFKFSRYGLKYFSFLLSILIIVRRLPHCQRIRGRFPDLGRAEDHRDPGGGQLGHVGDAGHKGLLRHLPQPPGIRAKHQACAHKEALIWLLITTMLSGYPLTRLWRRLAATFAGSVSILITTWGSVTTPRPGFLWRPPPSWATSCGTLAACSGGKRHKGRINICILYYNGIWVISISGPTPSARTECGPSRSLWA